MNHLIKICLLAACFHTAFADSTTVGASESNSPTKVLATSSAPPSPSPSSPSSVDSSASSGIAPDATGASSLPPSDPANNAVVATVQSPGQTAPPTATETTDDAPPTATETTDDAAGSQNSTETSPGASNVTIAKADDGCGLLQISYSLLILIGAFWLSNL